MDFLKLTTAEVPVYSVSIRVSYTALNVIIGGTVFCSSPGLDPMSEPSSCHLGILESSVW